MPRLLTQEERQQISLDLARTESAPAKLSDEVLSLARDLSLIHADKARHGKGGKVAVDQYFQYQRFVDKSKVAGARDIVSGPAE
jgi:hypothetical protein